MQTAAAALELRMSVVQADDKHDAAAQSLACRQLCGTAFAYEPSRVQLFALRRHIGFFAYLERAIWVAAHPGWLSLSLEPWFLYPGVASYEADIPDCVRLHPHYDNGDDGYLSPIYAYLDYGALILTPDGFSTLAPDGKFSCVPVASALASDTSFMARWRLTDHPSFMARLRLTDSLSLCSGIQTDTSFMARWRLTDHPSFMARLRLADSLPLCSATQTETSPLCLYGFDTAISKSINSLYMVLIPPFPSLSTLSVWFDTAISKSISSVYMARYRHFQVYHPLCSAFLADTSYDQNDTSGTPFSLTFIGYKTLLVLLMTKTYMTLLHWLTQIQWRTPSRGSVNGLFVCSIDPRLTWRWGEHYLWLSPSAPSLYLVTP